jgi:cysteine synthase A
MWRPWRRTGGGSTGQSPGCTPTRAAAPTPTLLRLPTPAGSPVDIYIKDESTHPTGSLKHRLARSLSLYALGNGDIDRGSTVVEASSGSTAISEAYFARLIGLPFVAVVARSTSPGKVALIEREGGRCEFVDTAPA